MSLSLWVCIYIKFLYTFKYPYTTIYIAKNRLGYPLKRSLYGRGQINYLNIHWFKRYNWKHLMHAIIYIPYVLGESIAITSDTALGYSKVEIPFRLFGWYWQLMGAVMFVYIGRVNITTSHGLRKSGWLFSLIDDNVSKRQASLEKKRSLKLTRLATNNGRER